MMKYNDNELLYLISETDEIAQKALCDICDRPKNHSANENCAVLKFDWTFNYIEP